MARKVRKSGVKDYRLENDPRFLRRIKQSRDSLKVGRGVRLEDIEKNSIGRRQLVDKISLQ
jgi:hypothetical protein